MCIRAAYCAYMDSRLRFGNGSSFPIISKQVKMSSITFLTSYRLEVTTQDAVTPSFAISSALRDPDQLGSEVYEELVGEEIYWTIDIPSKYTVWVY